MTPSVLNETRLLRARPPAQSVVTMYAIGAQAEAATQQKRHTPLNKRQVDVQVTRAIDIASRLRYPGLVVLNDPVGTGKTIVALTAARLLLDGTLGKATAIRRVLIVTPNKEIARVWRARSTWAGLAADGSRPEVVIRTVREVHELGRVGLPRSRPDLLVIVDEAHRGLHNKNTVAYEGLSTVARGARLLLVTATPFQLTGSGLETMLEVDGNDTRGDNIREYSKAVAAWLRREHEGDNPGTGPADLTDRRAEVRKALLLAQPDLEAVLMPPYPHKTMGRPRWMPMPAEPTLVKLGTWAQAYHAARTVPELVHDPDEALQVQNSDSYMRMLVSSTGAWHASHVYRSAFELGGPMRTLLKAIDTATGSRPADHPKVAATARAVADAVQQGHHVLIFCVFIATKTDLCVAVQAELRRRALRNSVTIADDLRKAQEALRAGFGQIPSKTNPPSVLIVSDKLSESVDLDGGKPVVVHHDLSWSPVRWEQRMGRVVRASTGFERPQSVIVPILDVDVDQRMWDTLKGRRRLASHVVGEKARDLLEESIIGLDVEAAE
jgi:superfamily II DNA or RNA helicase